MSPAEELLAEITETVGCTSIMWLWFAISVNALEATSSSVAKRGLIKADKLMTRLLACSEKPKKENEWEAISNIFQNSKERFFLIKRYSYNLKTKHLLKMDLSTCKRCSLSFRIRTATKEEAFYPPFIYMFRSRPRMSWLQKIKSLAGLSATEGVRAAHDREEWKRRVEDSTVLLRSYQTMV